MTTLERRRSAQRRGLRAETLAAWWLRLKGYRIVARQLRFPVGEIDMIARRGRTMAVVEVKRRDSLAAAAESIRPNQRRRIARAAEAYLMANPQHQTLDLRFDAVLLVPWRLPHHIPAAWS